jgi:sulfur-oxidizing protein SoxX
MRAIACFPLLLAMTAPALAQVADYKVVGDGIPQSLTGTAGSAARGKALVAKGEAATCLQCHAIKGMPGGGTRGPALDGVGAALTPAQLRLSVVDISRTNPKAIMPSFHKAGTAQSGDKPALGAQEVEDVVAYLATLKK